MPQIANWSQVDWKNPSHRAQVVQLMRGFFTEHLPASIEVPGATYSPSATKRREFELQNFTVAESHPKIYALAKEVMQAPPIDTGYLSVYEQVPMDQQAYQVATFGWDFVLRMMQPGASTPIGSTAGSGIWINGTWWSLGGGFPWQNLNNFTNFTIEKMLRGMNLAFWIGIARYAYGLMELVPPERTVEFQASPLLTSDVYYYTDRVKRTLEKALEMFFDEHAEDGLLPSYDQEFVAFGNLRNINSINQAIKLRSQQFVESEQTFPYNLRLERTRNLLDNRYAYLVIPGGFVNYGVHFKQQQFDEFDPRTLNQIFVDWICTAFSLYEGQVLRIEMEDIA